MDVYAKNALFSKMIKKIINIVGRIKGNPMRILCFLVILSALIVPSGFCAEDLWFIEQEFVKFGKKEAYEKYKKEMLKNDIGAFSTFAIQADDSLQYIYLTPFEDYCGLGDFSQKSANYDRSVRVPYLSTLNFTIESLQRYLPSCSSIPKGKEAITAYRYIYFYLLGIMPGNEDAFESRLQQIAGQQSENSEVCFRSWKILIGSDAPKYLVAVFAASEKQAQKRAEGLEFIDSPMKNILRTQKQGAAILRKDLSIIRDKNGIKNLQGGNGGY